MNLFIEFNFVFTKILDIVPIFDIAKKNICARGTLTRQPSNVDNLSEFKDATRLFYSNEEVGNYNHEQFIKLLQPVAQITARHSSATAKKYLLMIFQVFNHYFFG